MQEKDPVALKAAYRALLTSIVVGKMDENGRRKLTFNIRSDSEFRDFGNLAEKVGFDKKMAPQRPHVPEEFPLPKISIISSISNIPLYKNESFLRQKYLVEKLSISQISGLAFSARSTVLKHLGDFDIPIRSQGEAHRLNCGQLRYGEKKRKGHSVQYLVEAQNIKKMQTLRSQGYSYWKIAEVFNSMKIPTKNRGSRWHPTTVMKILKCQPNLSE